MGKHNVSTKSARVRGSKTRTNREPRHQLHKECGTRISIVRRCHSCERDLAFEEIRSGHEVHTRTAESGKRPDVSASPQRSTRDAAINLTQALLTSLNFGGTLADALDRARTIAMVVEAAVDEEKRPIGNVYSIADAMARRLARKAVS